MSKFNFVFSLALVFALLGTACNKDRVQKSNTIVPTGTPSVEVVNGQLFVVNSVVIYGVTFRWNYIDQTVTVYNDTIYKMHIGYGGDGRDMKDREFYMEPRSERVIQHRIARGNLVEAVVVKDGEIHSYTYKLGERMVEHERLQVRCDRDSESMVSVWCSAKQ